MALPGYVSTMNSQNRRQTALITGASSGIGWDLAHLMAADFDLIVTARNQKKLEELASQLESARGARVHVIPADLARPQAPAEIFAEIAHRGLQVDALVNNAGFGAYARFTAPTLRHGFEILQGKVPPVTQITPLALPR